MKKLNKLFLAAGSVAAIAAPVAAVVSCGTGKAGISSAMGIDLHTSKDASVWFIADGGSVQDKSFNESGLAAVAEYGNKAQKTYNFYQPSAGELKNGYEQASRHGAEIVLGAGFAHGDGSKEVSPKNNVAIPGDAAVKFATAEGKVPFIGIDATFTKGDQAGVKNLVSIMYNTQYAGYLAGLYAIDYIHSHKEEFRTRATGEKYKVSTFGGIGFNTVTAWMDGFRMAIDKDTTDDVEMLYVDKGATPNAHDFSGGFGLDAKDNGPQAIELNDKLIAGGADIIFPVAGAQTQITLSEIKAKRAQTKVIGVDGDQRKSLNSPLIIGSALKHIQSDAVAAIKAFYENKNEWNANYAGKVHVGEIGFVDANSADWSVQDFDAVKTYVDGNSQHLFATASGMGDWAKLSQTDITLTK